MYNNLKEVPNYEGEIEKGHTKVPVGMSVRCSHFIFFLFFFFSPFFGEGGEGEFSMTLLLTTIKRSLSITN